MAISLVELCNALATTIGAATEVDVVQSYDDLTEGIHDRNLLQVYPNSGNADAMGRTDRASFKGGVRVSAHIIHCDIHVAPASEIGQDMAETVAMIDSVWNKLEEQDVKPYFGQAGIQAWSWRYNYATFVYGAVENRGVRFYVEVWTY